jgi:hypothetical protein
MVDVRSYVLACDSRHWFFWAKGLSNSRSALMTRTAFTDGGRKVFRSCHSSAVTRRDELAIIESAARAPLRSKSLDMMASNINRGGTFVIQVIRPSFVFRYLVNDVQSRRVIAIDQVPLSKTHANVSAGHARSLGAVIDRGCRWPALREMDESSGQLCGDARFPSVYAHPPVSETACVGWHGTCFRVVD